MDTMTLPFRIKTKASEDTVRAKLTVNGIVQGVGFRPFIFNLANAYNLKGFVTNTGQGVHIEVQGWADSIQAFAQAVRRQAPPLSYIDEMNLTLLPAVETSGFIIRPSEDSRQNHTFIAPDSALCPDCLRELFDPADRRYLYPFINCTHCGPRFTIIQKVPYDRPFTAMAPFTMCPQCAAEYEDPANRRFHAQPNACPECGPQVWFEETASPPFAEKDAAFDAAVSFLQEGKIVAIKGLGGFHLAVDATNAQAVARLRARKFREEKPFAVMLADLAAVKQICEVNPQEADLLKGKESPIVLLHKKRMNPIAEDVAPGNRRLGVMLPYTPVHHILLHRLAQAASPDAVVALVMTSANRSEEPIVIDNTEAKKRLQAIADGFLMHNRDILIRSDDSVVFVQKNQTRMVRRSRGHVPKSISLPPAPEPILAVGGELKNTICLFKEEHAFVSQHIGDLENPRAHTFFEETVRHFQTLFTCSPNIIAHDMHPAYFSTQWAKSRQVRQTFAIQHHHAHMAAVMAEYDVHKPVLGLILDGTGFGTDGTIWGGELLFGDYTTVRRLAWLEPMPLPGGEIAIKQPWRLAAAYAWHSKIKDISTLPALHGNPVKEVLEITEKRVNTPLTSSCGRLFDAVAALCNVRTHIRYEAQAAIELTQLVNDPDAKPYPIPLTWPQLPVSTIIRAVVNDVQTGVAAEHIAARFHQTLIELFSKALIYAAQTYDVRTVVLSGGVFQNDILLNGLQDALQKRSLEVRIPGRFPVNDGGLSLGQAAIARELLRQKQNQVIWKK